MKLMKKGIDVSVHQGKIDWKKVKAAGIDFAIIRAGYGREISQKDKRFEENYVNAKAAGIKVGAYWYSYADSVSRGEQEAKTFLEVIKGKKFDLPVFFDQEYEKNILALTDAERTDIVLAFVKTVQAAGYDCGLYSSTDFIKNKLVTSRVSHLKIWLAEYGSKLHYTGKVWAWQYSSKGRVNGISGYVDMNRGYFEQTKTTLLRKGDSGDEVKLLQHRLNILGSQLKEDGIWGVQTDSAVRGYQYRAGLTVDGIVGAKTREKLVNDAILCQAAEIGAHMVKNKWNYKNNTYKAKATYKATKALEKPGSSCAHFVSWVLQDVGLLDYGKIISHKNGKVTGSENLKNCEIIYHGKTYDKITDMKPGDVCVWASNLAIYAGNGKWYDAGGPFQANSKNGRYIDVGPISPHYDRTKPIYRVIRFKTY